MEGIRLDAISEMIRRWGTVAGGFAIFFVAFFAPAEFGHLMASGDALLESLPDYYGAHRLWEPNMLLGYPEFANPNAMFWYPLFRLGVIPHSFNAMVVLPYALAAAGMAGFVATVTRSWAAAAVAGLVFSLGGFMISHEGHLMLIHPAAWTTLVLWSLEIVRRRAGAAPQVALALSVALCAVAGQPQVFAFGLTLAIAYAIVSARRATGGPRRYAVRAAIGLGLGIALGAIALIPSGVFAASSTRAALTLPQFLAFEIPPDQLLVRIVFPWLFGAAMAPYRFSIADLGGFAEMTLYAGLAPLVLACVGLVYARFDRRVWFWAFAALVGLTLAVGDATPLAQVTFHLPIYSLFRIAGRHAYEWTFAVAVLSGCGVVAVERSLVRRRTLAVGTGFVALLLATGVAQAAFSQRALVAQLSALYGVPASAVVSPLTNPAVGIPCGVFVLDSVGLTLWVSRRGHRAAALLPVAVVTLDLSSFAYFAYWRSSTTTEEALQPPPFVAPLVARADAEGGRILWVNDPNLPNPMPRKLSTLWNVPGVGGYAPLIPLRTAGLLDIDSSSTIDAEALTVPSDSALDIAGAALIAQPAESLSPLPVAHPFAGRDLHAFLGPMRIAPTSHAMFGPPTPERATRVELVSELGDAYAIPDGATAAQVAVSDVAGGTEHHPLLAGRDTAEFAYDRPDVRSRVKHRRAPIFSGSGNATHHYVTSIPIRSHRPISRVEVRWTYPDASAATSDAALTVERVSLVNDPTSTAYPLDGFGADRARFKPASVDARLTVRQNGRVRPYAWFAQPVELNFDEAVNAVHNRRLPDGRRFDAAQQALVESPVQGATATEGDAVRLVSRTSSRVVLVSACAASCFLVVRDAYDPQWSASIDGQPAMLYAADVAVRGVLLPSGQHRVVFTFMPWSAWVGGGVSLAAAVALIALLAVGRFKQGRAAYSSAVDEGRRMEPSVFGPA